jgi:hypothetical protein
MITNENEEAPATFTEIMVDPVDLISRNLGYRMTSHLRSYGRIQGFFDNGDHAVLGDWTNPASSRNGTIPVGTGIAGARPVRGGSFQLLEKYPSPGTIRIGPLTNRTALEEAVHLFGARLLGGVPTRQILRDGFAELGSVHPASGEPQDPKLLGQ